jgi:hypothetical protein
MEVHPGLGGVTPEQFWRGVAGGCPHHATFRPFEEAEIQEHRQAVTVPTQHIGGGQIAMQQVLAVERHEHRQKLA